MDERTGTELTIHQQEAVALTQNGGLDSVIKPLTKEIHLLTPDGCFAEQDNRPANGYSLCFHS